MPTHDPLRKLLELLNEAGLGQRTAPRSAPENDQLDKSYHEAGHALIAWYSPFVIAVQSVSIESDGELGGQALYTIIDSETAAGLYDNIAIKLGGLAGSLLLSKKIRGGPFTQDLLTARTFAEALAMHHEAFKLKHLGPGVKLRFDVASMFRTPPSLRARAFMNDALEESRHRLAIHKEPFARLVLELQQRKTLMTEDLLRLLGPRPWSPR